MNEVLTGLVDAARHDEWQASLIFEVRDYRDRDSDAAAERRRSVDEAQERLAHAVGGGSSATGQYLLSALCVENGAQALEEVPHLPNPLTAGEMSHLTAHAEKKLAELLHESLTTAQAANPAVWTICHAVWITRGDFGPNLAKVFFEGPRADTMEARTRNFLRRTGGLRRVRGNTSPLVDCPISAAWWRYRVALEVNNIASEKGRTLGVDEAHETLRQRNVWENLVGMSLRQVTAVSASIARAVVVAELARHRRESSGLTRAQVQGAIRELARLSYGHSLSHVPWIALERAAQRGIDGADSEDFAESGQ